MLKTASGGRLFYAVFSNRQINRMPAQMMRVMRMLTLFLFVACLSAAASGKAQSISINGKSLTYQQVFAAIKKQTGYAVGYDPDLFSGKTITLSVSSKPLREFLDMLLKDQPVEYDIQGKTIFITKKQQPVSPVQPAFTASQQLVRDNSSSFTGIVLSFKREPLGGASVRIKGTNKGTSTDAKGIFTLDVDSNQVLVISFTGYREKEIIVTAAMAASFSAQRPFVITLTLSENNYLNETVVIGYGTSKRKDLTGVVSSVNVNEIKNIPFATIDQALAGKAAGVQVVQADGSPGGVAKIRVRGGTSLMGGSDPLYIIDGVQVTVQNQYVQGAADIVSPIERGGSDPSGNSISSAFTRGLNSLSGLNINDIESIDILKDASATAIYGSRAANGVVIITTKKGKANQKAVLDVGYSEGHSFAKREKLLNAAQYKSLIQEGAININKERARVGLPEIEQYIALANNPDLLGMANTNWLDLVLRDGITREANVSVRGGGPASNYYTSLSYLKQNGVVKGTDFTQIAGRISVDNELGKRIRLNTALNYGFTKNNITNGAYTAAMFAPPTMKPYNDDGSVANYDGSGFGAPAYMGFQNPLDLLKGLNDNDGVNLMGIAGLQVDMLHNLKFRSSLSVNYSSSQQRSFTPSTVAIATPSGAGPSNGGIASESQNRSTNIILSNTITWDKQFGNNHHIDITAGTEWMKFRAHSFTASGQGFPDDQTLNNLSAASVPLPPSAYSGQSSLLSFYMRANYSWMKKYLFTFTGRSDASSKFPKHNRVSYFPSGAVAWQIGEENFMKKVKWVDELKLKASIGLTGTQNLGDNMFYTLFSPSSYAGAPSVLPYQIGNDKIKWETSVQKDIGLEFAFFRSIIRGSVGYYEKNAIHLLMNMPVPGSSGFYSVISNVANIKNRGIELNLNVSFINNKDFSWNGSFNIAGNRSKVMKVNNDLQNPNGIANRDPFLNSITLGNTIIREGQPIGLLYGYVFDGIARTEKEVEDYKQRAAFASFGLLPYFGIGDAMFKTVDSGQYKGYYARDVIGHAEPKFFGGYTNTFSYKGFSLTSLFTFSYGNELLYLADIQNLGLDTRSNKGRRILDHYSEKNPSSQRPRMLLGESGTTGITASNLNVYDASFIKLRSVTLNYQLSQKLISRFRLNNASVYVSATNLFTITKYPGADPEVSSDPYSLIGGYSDSGGYPQLKQYTLGLRVSF